MATEKRLISLDEALKATHGEIYWTESQQAAVRSFLVQQPKVDAVEVVHGRWVRKAHDGAFGVFHLWHCSVCDTIRARQDPYCGECGAKMEVDNG